MKRHLVLMVLVVGMLMISFVANQSVMAQETGIALGLGVGAGPDYEGSDDYQAVPIPYVNIMWSNHMSINLLGNKAKINLIPSPIWKAGVVGEYPLGVLDTVTQLPVFLSNPCLAAAQGVLLDCALGDGYPAQLTQDRRHLAHRYPEAIVQGMGACEHALAHTVCCSAVLARIDLRVLSADRATAIETLTDLDVVGGYLRLRCLGNVGAESALDAHLTKVGAPAKRTAIPLQWRCCQRPWHWERTWKSEGVCRLVLHGECVNTSMCSIRGGRIDCPSSRLYIMDRLKKMGLKPEKPWGAHSQAEWIPFTACGRTSLKTRQ